MNSVIVVAAAGNEGNYPYVTGSGLSAASKSISVAAGGDPGVFDIGLTVTGSSGADGEYLSTEAYITPTLASVGTISGHTAYVGEACDTIDQDLTGMIPLISRGTCSFQQKIII